MQNENYGRLLPCVLGLSLGLMAGCSSKSSPDNSSGNDSGASTPPGGGGPTGPAPTTGDATTALATAPATVLPPLPTLTNVVATEREDSVGIDFDPVDDAIDYRVYPLPKDSDVTINADNSLTIANAIYRCAGLRQTYDLPNGANNPSGVVPTGAQQYENPNQQYSWGASIPANPTLGYVYVVPGTGLVPVYAVAVHPTANELGWQESRPKIYTTSASTRASLIASGGRDDGIVFYVPSAAGSTTTTIYHSETSVVPGSGDPLSFSEYYFTSADKATHAGDKVPPTAAFQVLTAAATGTKPLMAVFYMPGQNHTELAVGKERFNRASNQGPGPLWHVEWAGVTEPTTLVVEALATGCPYQGFLSPQSVNAPPHQELVTLDQIQKASPTGEVYINGEYDLPGTTFPIQLGSGASGGMFGISDAGSPTMQTPNSSPVPIARSFIQVSPHPHDPTAWDWYEGFTVGTTLPPLTPAASDSNECQCMPTGPVPCIGGAGGCGYFTDTPFNVETYELDFENDTTLYALGQFQGQLWDVLDDVHQDVGGLTRFTANTTGTVTAGSYLHVTWSVDVMSTHRRYPQVLISDHPPPMQDALNATTSNTIILQNFSGTSPEPAFEEEAFHGLVNGRAWAVNNQAPGHWFINTDIWNANDPVNATLQPFASIFEHAGMDRMTTFDAYVSPTQVYTFVDGTPAGCTMNPTTGGFALSGKVWVTFGEVLYHESAPDEGICDKSHPYEFMHEHQCSEQKRHWDDLGIKSGVLPPAWDNTRFPCLAY